MTKVNLLEVKEDRRKLVQTDSRTNDNTISLKVDQLEETRVKASCGGSSNTVSYRFAGKVENRSRALGSPRYNGAQATGHKTRKDCLENVRK